MNACRRIAAHLLWTEQGIVRHPLVTLTPDGRVVSVETLAEPDRSPATEFYAGLLVPGFPADYRAAFAALRAGGGALTELLPRIVPARPGRIAVLSGLDYAEMRLTAQARIEVL